MNLRAFRSNIIITNNNNNYYYYYSTTTRTNRTALSRAAHTSTKAQHSSTIRTTRIQNQTYSRVNIIPQKVTVAQDLTCAHRT